MFGKEIDGVEVYQVGKLQLWTWCSWTRHGYDYCRSLGNERLYCSAKSLAKGNYVVLEGTVEFGRIWSRPWVIASFGSLKKAVEVVKDYQEFDYYKLGFQHCLSGNAISHFYEIWQICDDEELWADWDFAVEYYKMVDDGDSEKAETKSETVLDKAKRLEVEAQGNYDLYGVTTQGPTDILDYLGIYCGDYEELTDDAQDAIGDFWDNLTVLDDRYGHVCWNTLIDEEMTAKLAEHYSGRIWHNDGSLRFREC